MYRTHTRTHAPTRPPIDSSVESALMRNTHTYKFFCIHNQILSHLRVSLDELQSLSPTDARVFLVNSVRTQPVRNIDAATCISNRSCASGDAAVTTRPCGSRATFQGSFVCAGLIIIDVHGWMSSLCFTDYSFLLLDHALNLWLDMTHRAQ